MKLDKVQKILDTDYRHRKYFLELVLLFVREREVSHASKKKKTEVCVACHALL